MSDDRRIGSHAPLWRVGSPALVFRMLWPVFTVTAVLIVLAVVGTEEGSSFDIGAWVFGIFSGAVLVGAAIGYVVQRRISAKVRTYARANGFDFAVKDRQVTNGWRIAPNSTGALSRDVITGTLAGRALTSFLHQSFVSGGKSRSFGNWARAHAAGVRVTILDAGRELPAIALTPHRLSQVDSLTLPADRPVSIGRPAVEAGYHATTSDQAFTAELLATPVVAALRTAPQLSVRTWGTRVVVLASPLTTVDGIAASMHLLEVIGTRLAELAGVPAATSPARTQPVYVPPAPRRWRLSPFGDEVGEPARIDESRGELNGRPYLTFVHEREYGTGKDRTVTREQVIAIALPARLPHLEVWPENPLRTIAPSMTVREDIEIESDEFNRRFQVAAEDRKYAVDVLNPRAVQALLAEEDFDWRIDGSDLIGLWDPETATAEAVQSRLRALATVAELIPAHVVADHGWATEPASTTEEPIPALAPLRAKHIVSATLVGLTILAAGSPIVLAITEDTPGAPVGGFIVLLIITAVAVTLTAMLGRVVDHVRQQNESA